MTSTRNVNISCPPIGMAAWLLQGEWPQRIRWIADNGFDGVSFLQTVMNLDRKTHREIAKIISDTGLSVTYHGNVHHKILPDGQMDWEFVDHLMDDVEWWLDAGVPVASVCFDAIHTEKENIAGDKIFLYEMSANVVQKMSERLRHTDTCVGIENSFGSREMFHSLENFQRFYNLLPNSPPGMLLDLGHANIHVHSDAVDCETQIDKYIESIPFSILEVHVSGNKGKKDEHFEVGYGNLNLSAALSALKKRNYSRQITVEVCVDIQRGRYAADLTDAAQTLPLLRTRDVLRAAW